MALKKETIQKIEQLLKLKDLEAAIANKDEVDVSVDDKLQVFSETDLNTLKSNTYNDGKKAGAEMEVKTLKDELKLEFQGKTVKGLVEAVQKKTLEDANIEPTEKVKQLTTDLENVRTKYKELETTISQKEAAVLEARTDRELYKHIPKFGDNGPSISEVEFVSLMKANGYDFKLEDNKLVTYKGGEVLKDNLSKPLEAKDVISKFATEKKFITTNGVEGGRGGGDKKDSPARFGSFSELKKHAEEKGISTQGSEFQNLYQQAVKENKEFKMDA